MVMKILHVITGLQKAAGTSVFCGEICNQLVERGHEVTIAICNPFAPDHYPLDSRIHLVSIDEVVVGSCSCRKEGAFHSTTTTPDYDLVHIHALWSPVLHKVAKWARQKHIPIVWSPHGMITPWAMRNKRMKKLLGWWLYQKWDLKSAALLHATAQSEVDDIRRLGLRNKIVLAPLGVKLPQSAGYTVLSAPEKKIKTLLFVSRVQRKKGLPNLIEAWSRLKKVKVGGEGEQRNGKFLTDGWQVRIVGPDQDNHTAELMAQCTRLGLTYQDLTHHSTTTTSGYNFVFAGPKYGDDLTREYASADLFVLPTHSENFGSVVIEALAHGVPVITTKQAPWAELEEYNCGWWIDDQVAALAETIGKALDADDLVDMGMRGRKLVSSRYTWAAVCGKMICRYESVVK